MQEYPPESAPSALPFVFQHTPTPGFARWIAAVLTAAWLPVVLCAAVELLIGTTPVSWLERVILVFGTMAVGGTSAGLAIIGRKATAPMPRTIPLATLASTFATAWFATDIRYQTLVAWGVISIALCIVYLAYGRLVHHPVSETPDMQAAAGLPDTPALHGHAGLLSSSLDYFRFSGRIGVRAFWLNFQLPALMLGLFVSIAVDHLSYGDRPHYVGSVMLLYFVLFFWLEITAMVRRMHDLDRPAWMLAVALLLVFFFGLFPKPLEYFGIIVLSSLIFGLGIFKGSPGTNRFGPVRPYRGVFNLYGSIVILIAPLLLELPYLADRIYPFLYDRYLDARLHTDLQTEEPSIVTAPFDGVPSKTLAVLFIGTSNTVVNNLPYMVSSIGTSSKPDPVRIITAALAVPGATLSDYLANGSAARMIASRRWDYVVLQDNNSWPMREDGIKSANTTMPVLVDMIRDNGAKPVLFVTWARRPGSSSYPRAEGMNFQNFDYMQQKIDTEYAAIASRTGAAEVAVGDYWKRAAEKDPSLDLYMAGDDVFPGDYGTYLTALLFFKFLTDQSPADVTFAPDTVSSADAAELKSLAASPAPN